jgi:hypothetical protein
MKSSGWRAAAGIACVLLTSLSGACEERGSVEKSTSVRERLEVQISSEFDVERYPELFTSGAPYVMACGSIRCIAFYQVDLHVYAGRVDQTGRTIDPHPIWVGAGGAPIAAAAKNDDFIVIWGDQQDRRATRLRGSDGQATDLTSQLPSSTGDYDLGTDGNSWLVLHYGATVRAIVKAPDTFASMGTPVQLSTDASRPRIVPGDGQYLLLGTRRATRVSAATGAPLDPAPIEFSKYGTLSREPRAVYKDGIYVVTWAGDDKVFVSRIRASDGARLDPDDDFSQVSGAKVICSGQTGANYPFALALGNSVLVMWTKDASTTLEGQAARVNPSTGTRVSGAASAPEIVLHYPLAWGFFYNGNWGMYGSTGVRPVQVQETPLAVTVGPETLPVAYEIEARSLPSVASNGTSFFVAWRKEDHLGTSSSFRIFGSRVSAGGEYLDDPPIDFGPGHMATVAARGQDYLVAYATGAEGIQRRFVSASGQLGPPLPAIPHVTSNLRLAHDHRNFLLAWESWDGSTIRLRAARLDANGALLDTTPLTLTTQSAVRFLAVADTAPAQNLRTFTVLYDTLASPARTLARLVRSESGVLIEPATALTAGSLQAATSDGSRTLVVFMGNALSAGLSDPLTGAFDSPAVQLSGIPNSASITSVYAWNDGKSYLLGLRTNNGDNRTSTLAVRRYSAALAPLDSAVPGTGTVAVPDWSNAYPSAAVAGDGAGRSLLVYVQDDPQRLGTAVKARFIVNDGLPANGSGGTGGAAGSGGRGGTGGTESGNGGSGTGSGATGGASADASMDAVGGATGAGGGSVATGGTGAVADADSSTEGASGAAGSSVAGASGASAAGSGGAGSTGSGETTDSGHGGSSPGGIDAGRQPDPPSGASSDEGGCGCRTFKRSPVDFEPLALAGCAVILWRRGRSIRHPLRSPAATPTRGSPR